MRQRFDSKMTEPSDPSHPLDKQIAELLKVDGYASCAGVKSLLSQRAAVTASLRNVSSLERAAMAAYEGCVSNLCDALDESLNGAARDEAVQSFWIAVIEIIDELERFRAEQGLRWDADGGRICATRFTVLTARATALVERASKAPAATVAAAVDAPDAAVAAVHEHLRAARILDSASTVDAWQRRLCEDDAVGGANAAPGLGADGAAAPPEPAPVMMCIEHQDGDKVQFKVKASTRIRTVRTLDRLAALHKLGVAAETLHARVALVRTGCAPAVRTNHALAERSSVAAGNQLCRRSHTVCALQVIRKYLEHESKSVSGLRCASFACNQFRARGQTCNTLASAELGARHTHASCLHVAAALRAVTVSLLLRVGAHVSVVVASAIKHSLCM